MLQQRHRKGAAQTVCYAPMQPRAKLIQLRRADDGHKQNITVKATNIRVRDHVPTQSRALRFENLEGDVTERFLTNAKERANLNQKLQLCWHDANNSKRNMQFLKGNKSFGQLRMIRTKGSANCLGT